jgi:hypothetical protein
MTTSEQARRAEEVVVRIDQGDYLQERGGFDWGRSNEYDATTYGSVAEAEAAVARLRAPGIEIEAAPGC